MADRVKMDRATAIIAGKTVIKFDSKEKAADDLNSSIDLRSVIRYLARNFFVLGSIKFTECTLEKYFLNTTFCQRFK